ELASFHLRPAAFAERLQQVLDRDGRAKAFQAPEPSSAPRRSFPVAAAASRHRLRPAVTSATAFSAQAVAAGDEQAQPVAARSHPAADSGSPVVDVEPSRTGSSF